MILPNLRLFPKSFTSLVITPRRIQVVKLNSKHTAVERFGQLEIPPGVIMNYRVKNQEVLSGLIKEAWKKFRLSDKYVGVVVPEFSTYTKILTLPNLTDTEINEALSWQLQEYLPMPVSEVVSDWKIIKRTKEEIQILVVAILKNVLLGYIDAVGEAGLYPLVVETPSLSVQRITDGDESGKLVIYVNDQEALLLVSEGEKIIASSVVSSQDLNVVVNTSVQLLNHFNKVHIQKIYIAGLGLTQDLVQFLNYNLGRPVQVINAQIKGMSPPQVQDLLIAVSLQRKDPAEPSSELTINLLPPNWAKHYKEKQRGIQIWTLTLIASIVIWADFLAVVIVWMLMGIQVKDFQNSAEVQQTAELNKVTTEVKDVNSLADKITNLSLVSKPPQELLNLISKTIPDGIIVSDYVVNYDSGSIKITGVADSRTSLLSLKNALEANKDFDSIEVPLSSLLKEFDISFEVKLVYVPLTSARKNAPIKLKV